MHKTTNEIRISDWSSDVCSSDLFAHAASHLIELIGRRSSAGDQLPERIRAHWGQIERDGLGRRARKSVVSGKSVSVSVDIGGCRSITNKKTSVIHRHIVS